MTKPIETRYAGCHFRSRIEARWAVFFDHLHLQWEYEKEGFELQSGRYLPDFWLRDLNAWFEVKGTEPTHRERQLAAELAASTQTRVFIVHGDVPREADIGGPKESHITALLPNLDESGQPHAAEDEHYAWCVCPRCGKVGIEFDARGARICADTHGEPGGRGHTGSNERIHAAYQAARSARFEHGQSGP